MTDPAQLPLKDIHLPGGISWWPPAPGWWFLLGLMIIVVIAVYLWRQHKQRVLRSALYMARQELVHLQEEYARHQDARRFVAELSVLIRRLSISAFPRVETASLTGNAWLQFLDRPLAKPVFSNGPGRILVEAPYRPDVNSAELQPLVEVCQEWIDRLADKKRGERA